MALTAVLLTSNHSPLRIKTVHLTWNLTARRLYQLLKRKSEWQAKSNRVTRTTTTNTGSRTIEYMLRKRRNHNAAYVGV